MSSLAWMSFPRKFSYILNPRRWMDFPKIDFELKLIGSCKIAMGTFSRNLSSQSGLSTTYPNSSLKIETSNWPMIKIFLKFLITAGSHGLNLTRRCSHRISHQVCSSKFPTELPFLERTRSYQIVTYMERNRTRSNQVQLVTENQLEGR